MVNKVFFDVVFQLSFNVEHISLEKCLKVSVLHQKYEANGDLFGIQSDV